MEPNVIFQDDYIIVLDKPSGWITNEAQTTSGQPVIQTWLKNSFDYPISKSHEFRSGIVHRLDKETSGVLLIAKTEDAFNELQRQFKEREIKKTYIALVHGFIEPKSGLIKAPVGRLPWRRDRFGVLPGGRDSVTKYEVISNYTFQKASKNHLKEYSLTKFFPETGRTHQIRIHAKHIGHPLVSDEFYAGRKTAREDRKWCQRLFLHAGSISFTHPINNVRCEYESGISGDLNLALGFLQPNKT